MDKSLQLINAIVAAKFLGISTTTLGEWVRRPEGPPRRKIGNRYYYQRDALTRWLELRDPQHQPPPRLPLRGRALALPVA